MSTTGKPKVPRTPAQPLRLVADDIATWTAPLFRIHRVTGAYPSRWDEFRTFGPVTGCRWDHHPNPPGEHQGYGILYAASDPHTAMAEVFQTHRIIRLSSQMMLSGWEPTRELTLLDLTSIWPVRNGAGRALTAAPRSTCRSWAQAIAAQAPDHLDGLVTDSTLTGKAARVVVLWEPAQDAFPQAPAMSMPMDSPALAALIANAARETGYRIG